MLEAQLVRKNGSPRAGRAASRADPAGTSEKGHLLPHRAAWITSHELSPSKSHSRADLLETKANLSRATAAGVRPELGWRPQRERAWSRLSGSPSGQPSSCLCPCAVAPLTRGRRYGQDGLSFLSLHHLPCRPGHHLRRGRQLSDLPASRLRRQRLRRQRKTPHPDPARQTPARSLLRRHRGLPSRPHVGQRGFSSD